MTWHDRFDRLLKAMASGGPPKPKEHGENNPPSAKPHKSRRD